MDKLIRIILFISIYLTGNNINQMDYLIQNILSLIVYLKLIANR